MLLEYDHGQIFRQQQLAKGNIMDITIVNTPGKPLYMQIKEQIKKAIFIGELHDGDMLPSIRKLANDLNVSVLTTRRVYDELESEGFITRQMGLGTFVSIKDLGLIQEFRRKVIEDKLEDIIEYATNIGISKEEFFEILKILYEEKNI